MKIEPYRVMFLCTGNSARSIMAEAMLNKLGAPDIEAYSSGSKPQGEPNPLALAALTQNGFATAGLRSKSWDMFAAGQGPKLDLVITVCDRAAQERCPVWTGAPLTAAWFLPDPAAPPVNPESFRKICISLGARIHVLVKIIREHPAPDVLKKKIQDLS